MKAATAKPAEDEDDADDDVVSAETSLSLEELKKLKSDLAEARREVKRLEADFLNQLRHRVGHLDASVEELLVRHILKADLKKRLIVPDTDVASASLRNRRSAQGVALGGNVGGGW